MEAPAVDILLYQRMVGKLMFLTQTWLDFFFVVNMFSMFSHKLQTFHLEPLNICFSTSKGQ
jgi:hypothetical protein